MDCDNISLNGLDQLNPCDNNESGVKTAYFCPVKDILAINATHIPNPTSLDDFVTIGSSTLTRQAITCKPGKGFVKVYSADEMGELKYAQQGDIPGCRSWKGSLELFHPGFKRTAIGFMAYINNQDVVVVAKLNNGQYHLLGDIDRGAKLASGNEMTSGKEATSNNGINPVLEYNLGRQQIFWDGFDPNDPTTGIPILGATNADTGNDDSGNDDTGNNDPEEVTEP